MDEEKQLADAKMRVMRMLGKRALSSKEIEKRLLAKGDSQQTAKQVVEWLEATGMIDDTEYAHAIVRHYQAKGYGIARIKEELYSRGLESDVRNEAIEELDTTKTQDAIQRFLEKKLKGSKDKADLRSAEQALCRRGYNYGQARSAINTYLETCEDE